MPYLHAAIKKGLCTYSLHGDLWNITNFTIERSKKFEPFQLLLLLWVESIRTKSVGNLRNLRAIWYSFLTTSYAKRPQKGFVVVVSVIQTWAKNFVVDQKMLQIKCSKWNTLSIKIYLRTVFFAKNGLFLPWSLYFFVLFFLISALLSLWIIDKCLLKWSGIQHLFCIFFSMRCCAR